MYNILATDDEQISIDSLSFIINKNFEGQVNIFTALSGTEALEIVSKQEIDIVFMDINMPGLNGLETVSCITKIRPETVVIILSAFDSFQYAQEAMNLGAFKYITKPVNRNVVIQTIRTAMDLIDSRRGKMSADMELHKKLDMVSPMIESDFIYACIFNKEKDFDFNSYLSYFNMNERPWCFCCFEIPRITSENQYSTYMQIRTFLNEKHRCLVSSFMMNRIVVLYPVFSETLEQNLINAEIRKLYSDMSFRIGAGIRLGVSAVQEKWSGQTLKESYSQALRCLNQTPVEGGILFEINENEKNAPVSDGMNGMNGMQQQEVLSYQDEKNMRTAETFKKQIISCLRQGDSNGIKSFMDLYSSSVQEINSDLNYFKNVCFELIVTAKNVTAEINPAFENREFDNSFSVLSTLNDRGMVLDYVLEVLLNDVSAVLGSKIHSENPIIKKVCDYINENLSQEISLEQMADYVKVSSFYLSKLFKENKGVTFVNFLADRRLEKARTLLKETDLSIKEITAEVGYNDQNYFSRLFRNKFGVTPSDFRK